MGEEKKGEIIILNIKQLKKRKKTGSKKHILDLANILFMKHASSSRIHLRLKG